MNQTNLFDSSLGVGKFIDAVYWKEWEPVSDDPFSPVKRGSSRCTNMSLSLRENPCFASRLFFSDAGK